MEPKFLDVSDIADIGGSCLEVLSQLMPILPGELWHYTTASGLIGILKSKCLKASHITGMNDADEYNYSISSLSKAIEIRLSEESQVSGETRVMLEKFRVSLNIGGLKRENVPPIFVACFTQDVDLANHWGEYGDRGKGYAIGFSVPDLLQAGNDQGLFLLKCIYDNQETDQIMEKIVKQLEKVFADVLSKNSNVSIEEISDDFINYYAWNLSFLAPAFKSPTFVNESEWRISRRLDNHDYSQMTFESKKSEIRPYIKFDLSTVTKKTELLPITRIYIGPARGELDKELGLNAIRSLLRQHGYPDSVGVFCSKSSFRG
jgi:DUF2971 family protein